MTWHGRWPLCSGGAIQFGRRLPVAYPARNSYRINMNLQTPNLIHHLPLAQSRRDFLYRAGGGLGGIALSWLLARDGFAGESAKRATNPLAAKKPHFETK